MTYSPPAPHRLRPYLEISLARQNMHRSFLKRFSKRPSVRWSGSVYDDGHRLEMPHIRDAGQMPALPPPACREERIARRREQVGIGHHIDAGIARKSCILSPASKLDQPPAPKSPSISACFRAIAVSIRIGTIGYLFRVMRISFGDGFRKPASASFS